MRVMIADDSAQMRELLSSLVAEIEGLRVAGVAADGVEACRLVHELRPDISILDLRMPRLNGLQVLRRIRELDKSAIVIMLSGDALADNKTICLAGGADYVFNKATELPRCLTVLASVARFAELATDQDVQAERHAADIRELEQRIRGRLALARD